MEPEQSAFAPRPFHRNRSGPDVAGTDRFLVQVPSRIGEEERSDPNRDSRNTHPCRILRGLAESVGGFPYGKRSLAGGNADSVAAGSLEAYAQTIIFPVGKPNDAYAKYFIGQSYTAPVVTDGVPVVNVTFEPGCRNNWHVHKATKGGGQTLVCVGGRGYYQEWGKEPVELHSGDAINIPAGVKHWHGAAPDSWFSHLAIEVPGENNSTEWLEPVGDEEYAKLK